MNRRTVPSSQLLRDARVLHQQGRLADAASLYQKTLKDDPANFDAMHLLGVLRYQQGRNTEAADLIGAALRIVPNAPHALSNYALCLNGLGRLDEALENYNRALAIEPNYPEAYNNKGTLLASRGRYREALECYDKATALRPAYAEAFCNRGDVQRALHRYEDALTSYGATLKFEPSYFEAYLGRADALCSLDRHQESLADYDRALALAPRDPVALSNRAVALNHLGLHDRALRDLDLAISIKPDFAAAWNNRGNVQRKMRRHADALASYDRALGIQNNYPEALNNRGNVLCSLMRFAQALASYDQALKQRPDYVDAWVNRGNLLADANRHGEAVVSYECALTLAPENSFAFENYALSALAACDWPRVEKISGELSDRVIGKRQPIDPMLVVLCKDDPALQLASAKAYCEALTVKTRARTDFKRSHSKIRLGYLSADFRRHPTSYLIAELFEIHDRSRFELFGFSYGRDDGSPMRARIAGSFDRFEDVQAKSDVEVVKLMGELEIDIAVDLMGHTRDTRLNILAGRPAPIQVSYLGYPGTIGADFVDYVIGDRFVVPADQQPFYSERIVHLPDCYQANDTKRKIADRTPTRREMGLPDEGFVFGCFNNTLKLTPAIFEIWMRLLQRVPSSVLWLLRSNESAEANLRNEAASRGVVPTRLVFAEKVSLDDHLARCRLADLFLDTLPYNAHTTASDALWAGLPVLTCRGQTFAARVAGSLLHAVGLPELATNSLDEYESLALRLAIEERLLKSLRQKLAVNRLNCPLFDTHSFRRHIEAAYTTMWRILQSGEGPRSFAVSPDSGSGPAGA